MFQTRPNSISVLVLVENSQNTIKTILKMRLKKSSFSWFSSFSVFLKIQNTRDMSCETRFDLWAPLLLYWIDHTLNSLFPSNCCLFQKKYTNYWLAKRFQLIRCTLVVQKKIIDTKIVSLSIFYFIKLNYNIQF